MVIKYKGKDLFFTEVKLVFYNKTYSNIFSEKNNKTLAETINSRRYQKFKELVQVKYPNYLNWELGRFLLRLKNEQDNYYLNFLNKYGDKTYCNFKIIDELFGNKKGIYIYYIDSDLKYIGRSLDPFYKRINHSGYGKIHPKNCYIDGQSTNCHLNYLITQIKDKIKFAVLTLNKDDEIKTMEKELIYQYKPEWNLQF